MAETLSSPKARASIVRNAKPLKVSSIRSLERIARTSPPAFLFPYSLVKEQGRTMKLPPLLRLREIMHIVREARRRQSERPADDIYRAPKPFSSPIKRITLTQASKDQLVGKTSVSLSSQARIYILQRTLSSPIRPYQPDSGIRLSSRCCPWPAGIRACSRRRINLARRPPLASTGGGPRRDPKAYLLLFGPPGVHRCWGENLGRVLLGEFFPAAARCPD
jgi:hypothetical protein